MTGETASVPVTQTQAMNVCPQACVKGQSHLDFREPEALWRGSSLPAQTSNNRHGGIPGDGF